MKKIILIAAAMLMTAGLQAQTFETATQAVHNMGIGWNLGNTLESNSNDTANMWIERWSSVQPAPPSEYEKAWGQGVSPELIHAIKEAGFSAIRVPVTWYPHMGIVLSARTDNDGLTWYKSQWEPTPVDEVWMARVEEVVNMVLNEGLYCVLNVHHDTGAAQCAWLHATGAGFTYAEPIFRSLWEQIATRFQNYDEKLIFEAYNEMLDGYNSWCFASLAGPNGYNASAAADTYQAINNYAAAFVETVRQTGGNNSQRNLMVNTYGACSGHGTWNSHLKDPLTQFTVPTDPTGTQDHIMMSVHSYPSLKNSNGNYISKTTMESQNTQQIQVLQQYLQQDKGMPVVVGEWGTADSDGNNYTANNTLYLQFVKDFTTRCLGAGICPMYWMGVSDGKEARLSGTINQADLVQSMMSALAVEEVEAPEQTSSKFVRDGQMLIRRGEHTYTLTGICVE